jgi:serine/threonine-protein kinase RsbW
VILLRIPSRLEYRDLAIRTVASACRLVPGTRDDFYEEVISAFGEALNNLVLHGYRARPGEIEIEIEPRSDRLVIRLMDHGETFDPATVPALDLDSLHESGMGVFIMRSFMDDVTYVGGAPNTLSMTKYSKGNKKKS